MTPQKITLRDLYKSVNDLRDEIRETYVTKSEFMPVKMIAYGLVGTATAVVLRAIVVSVVNATQ